MALIKTRCISCDAPLVIDPQVSKICPFCDLPYDIKSVDVSDIESVRNNQESVNPKFKLPFGKKPQPQMVKTRCVNCDSALVVDISKSTVCPYCKLPYDIKIVNTNDTDNNENNKEMVCKVCGTRISSQDAFCMKCGSKLDGADVKTSDPVKLNNQAVGNNAGKGPDSQYIYQSNKESVITADGEEHNNVNKDWIVRLKGVVGEVIWFNPEKGYGFARTQINSLWLDVFMHFSLINNFDDNIKEGNMVIFDLAEKKDTYGKLSAINASILHQNLDKQ